MTLIIRFSAKAFKLENSIASKPGFHDTRLRRKNGEQKHTQSEELYDWKWKIPNGEAIKNRACEQTRNSNNNGALLILAFLFDEFEWRILPNVRLNQSDINNNRGRGINNRKGYPGAGLLLVLLVDRPITCLGSRNRTHERSSLIVYVEIK